MVMPCLLPQSQSYLLADVQGSGTILPLAQLAGTAAYRAQDERCRLPAVRWVPSEQELSKGVCGSVSAGLPPPVRLLPGWTLFLRHKYKMELVGSKTICLKWLHCKRECQARKQRERAPPAVQHRDPIFLHSIFFNMSKEILQNPTQFCPESW